MAIANIKSKNGEEPEVTSMRNIESEFSEEVIVRSYS